MRWSGFMLAVALVALAGTREAAAQDAAKADSTIALIDLGYVQTSGNTDVQTVTGRERLEHYTGAWTFKWGHCPRRSARWADTWRDRNR